MGTGQWSWSQHYIYLYLHHEKRSRVGLVTKKESLSLHCVGTMIKTTCCFLFILTGNIDLLPVWPLSLTWPNFANYLCKDPFGWEVPPSEAKYKNKNLKELWSWLNLLYSSAIKTQARRKRGGEGGERPPLFGEKRRFFHSNSLGNWLNLNFYVWNFFVVKKTVDFRPFFSKKMAPVWVILRFILNNRTAPAIGWSLTKIFPGPCF